MTKTTLQIDGMMCGMCEAHVNDAIRKAFKVSKVKSSHKKGMTEIVSDEPLNEEEIKKAVGDTGYKVLAINSEAYEKKGLFSREK